MKRQNIFLSLLLLLSSAELLKAQGCDTSATKKNLFTIFPALNFYTHCNGGDFYTAYNFEQKNKYFDEVVAKPMVTFSLGVKFKSIFLFADYLSGSKPGNFSADFGSDNLQLLYFCTQIGYDPFYKKNYWIRPLVLLNLGYTEKKYYFSHGIDFGGNVNFETYNDHSTLYFLQIPIGFQLAYHHAFLTATYNIPLYTQINGSYTDVQSYYSPNTGSSSTTVSGAYSGTTNGSNYDNFINIISVRVGFILNINRGLFKKNKSNEDRKTNNR